MKKQFYRMLFIALLALMQTTWVQAQVNNEVRKVPPGAPQNVIVKERLSDKNQNSFQHKKNYQMKHADEDIPTHELTINLEYDNTKYKVCDKFVYNEEYGYNEPQITDNLYTFSVKEGKYDIYVLFGNLNSIWMTANFSVIVKEGVDCFEDIEITIKPEEATNRIDFNLTYSNGEVARVPYCDYTQYDENGKWLVLDPGNTISMYESYEISKPNFCHFGFHDLLTFLLDSPDNTLSTLYVNDLSDNYTITNHAFAIDYDKNLYTTTFETKGGESKTITNDSNEYEVYELQFSQSEYSKSQLEKPYISYLTYGGHIDDDGSIFFHSETNLYQWEYLLKPNNNNSVKVYLGQAPSNPDFDFCTKVLPSLVETVSVNVIDEEYDIKEYVYSYLVPQPIVQRKGKTQRYNFGRSTCESSIVSSVRYLYYKDENNEQTGADWFFGDLWVENPILSYLPDKIKGVQGDNVPIIVPCKHSDWNPYYNANVTYIEPCYLGRYGEFCESDMNATHTNIKIDSEEYIDTDEPVYGWLEENELSGVVDITMTNQNRIIDGLQGKSLATIHYDRDQEDCSAPVLQMLHFKDGEGYITDRFENGEGALMELFAGDFNEGISEQNWLYFDRAKAKNVSVAYAPYGKDNWTDLTLEENPEYYSNLMGWYYAASLEDVAGAAEQGWFDLKIRLEDEAGNWQEQVISPAFQIKSLVDTGISQLTIDNGQLTIPGNENVYDLMGRCIGNAPSSTDKGIRIVRKANGDFRKVILR